MKTNCKSEEFRMTRVNENMKQIDDKIYFEKNSEILRNFNTI